MDLSHADLSKSTGVTSPQTSFVGAILSDGGTQHGVNLSGQVFPEGTDHLQGQNLAYANLSEVQLVGAKLQGTNLSHATLNDINLTDADLEGADLSNALLHHATLDFASLRHAKLQGIQAGVPPGQSGQATSFKNAYMPSVDLTDADLRSADLSDAHIYGDTTTWLSLLRTKLDSADLTGALLSGAAFSGSLTDAVFNHAVLVNSTFNGQPHQRQVRRYLSPGGEFYRGQQPDRGFLHQRRLFHGHAVSRRECHGRPTVRVELYRAGWHPADCGLYRHSAGGTGH